jgi:hypothetical protein
MHIKTISNPMFMESCKNTWGRKWMLNWEESGHGLI